MAIERQLPEQLNQNKSKTDDDLQFEEIINIDTDESPEGITMMEDGGALLGPQEEEPQDIGFDGNLAEIVGENELNVIANNLVGSIEKDKSSRKDWEKTYTDGLKYLGMKFDEDRSEPFEGASGVIHPLLAE